LQRFLRTPAANGVRAPPDNPLLWRAAENYKRSRVPFYALISRPVFLRRGVSKDRLAGSFTFDPRVQTARLALPHCSPDALSTAASRPVADVGREASRSHREIGRSVTVARVEPPTAKPTKHHGLQAHNS
jgi:hypothetical protein